YFDTNTTYFQGDCATGQTVLNRTSLNGQVFDSYSQGGSLNDGTLINVVRNAIGSGALPVDSSGVYFVLSSADVAETSGFCSSYCGFHNQVPAFGVVIKYAFVGNPDRCPSSCEGRPGNSPNGNAGADGMANVIAHELNEAVTDPELTAWFRNNVQGENGDLCNFNFGPTFIAPNGSLANVTLGSRNFLVQQNWVNFNGGFCGLGVGAPPPLNGAFVEQQYMDFLDRAADAGEFSSSTNGLANGFPRSALIQGLINSQEFAVKGKLVASAYLGLLTREADYGGFRGWLNDLNNGLPQEALVNGFINSGEFQNNFGGNLTNEQFVTVMYQN